MLLDSAVGRLYHLNVGTTPVEEGSPHERPHKPLLLLAAVDLMDAAHLIPFSENQNDHPTNGPSSRRSPTAKKNSPM
jgi:hypothetical protein